MQRCWRLKPRLDGPVGREVRVCGLGVRLVEGNLRRRVWRRLVALQVRFQPPAAIFSNDFSRTILSELQSA